MCVGDGGQDDQDDIITTTITKVIIITITREVLRLTFKSKWVGGTDYTITIMGGDNKAGHHPRLEQRTRAARIIRGGAP